ncbi:MAG TPA: purine-nucleoside phosphorylase [Terrimicrobiaceae bacterium]|nr:purine-nucleoside phosphorylase [Terrimicrobiaceae bacterium]
MAEETFQIPDALRDCGARLAVVLGSGLGPFAESLEHELVVHFGDVPDLPVSRVPGHAGRFVVARLAGQPILIAQGRVHLYEGWDAREVTRSVRLMHRLGIETLVLTNAAGTVNPEFPPGDWMMLADHINLTGYSPLHGGPNFFDMSEVYSRELRRIFRETSTTLGITLHEGVYAAMPGPQYETPAEIRMLKTLGADAVGMSTVPEAIQARALGMKVAAFSCLTNWGAGLSDSELSHEEVTTTGRQAADTLARLLHAVLPDIAS